MKTALKIVSLIVLPVALLLLLTFSAPPFSDSKTPQLIAKANLFNMQFPQEKIYLHLDKASYWASDDIWFKAYLKDSPIPECNLYVELLNSSGTVIDKKICWAQGGLAYGDFHLADTTSVGVYQVRAYTNWMRNFDEAWFFRKDIVILNIQEKLPAYEPNALKEKEIDIQFFPEGGTLVNGLKSKVAFKAADPKGKGLDVEGKIIDDFGNEVARLKSDFKGMGNFMLQPREGRKYKAEVKVAGTIELSVDLPVAEPQGVILSVDSQDPSKIAIQISKKSLPSTDQSTSEYTLVGQTKGGVFYRKNMALELDAYHLSIEKDQLPNGIIQFTLFDQNALPVCERLIFINRFDYVNVEIFPNKETYLTRERVQLDLEAFGKQETPYLSNLSMSVYNSETQLKTEDYPNNILTQFLLSSELKGAIEEPAYYFKDDSVSTSQALDNLMLTHGYRHFEWKQISEGKFPKIIYPAEECIQVRGTVKSLVLEKTIPNCSVTMMTVKSQLSVTEQKTDSLGKFLFSDLYFNDTIYVSLQALNPKGRKNTIIEVDKRSSTSPETALLPFTYQYSKEDPKTTTSSMSEANAEFINRKWRLSDTILLNDINIQGYKQKKDDGHFRMYSDADFVFELKKQDDVLGSIFDALDGKIPGVRFEESEKAFISRNQPVLIYLDGIPADYQLLSTFSSQTFDKVEFIRSAIEVGINYPGGILYFYTKRGTKFENRPTDGLGMKSSRVIGYSVMRKFYSPKYETQLPTDVKNDFRSTLYWNPIVRTDSLGRAAVTFYNSDQTGEVQVVVEGVTSDGKLCRGVATYNVRSK